MSGELSAADAPQSGAEPAPDQILAELREANLALPPVLVTSPAEDEVLDAAVQALRTQDPELSAQIEPYTSRAVSTLFAALRLHRPDDAPTLTDPSRLAAIGATLFRHIADQPASRHDPVQRALNLHHRSLLPEHRPKIEKPRVPGPLEKEPPILLGEMRSNIRTGLVTLRGDISQQHVHAVSKLTRTIMLGGQRGEVDATVLATELTKAMGRHVRFNTGETLPTDSTTPTELLPHLLQYLEEAEALRAAGVPRPHRRALHYSPGELAAIHRSWVASGKLPPWAFYSVLASDVLDIEPTLSALHNKLASEVQHTDSLQAEFVQIAEPTKPAPKHEGSVSIDKVVKNLKYIGHLIERLPDFDARILAIVYDLPLFKEEGVAAKTVASRVVHPKYFVSRTETWILPQLATLAAQHGFEP